MISDFNQNKQFGAFAAMMQGCMPTLDARANVWFALKAMQCDVAAALGMAASSPNPDNSAIRVLDKLIQSLDPDYIAIDYDAFDEISKIPGTK